MKQKDPAFWQKLEMKDSPDLPSENLKADLPEDSLPTTEEEDEDFDDSDVPIQTLVAMVVGDEMPAGVATCSSGSLMSIRAADGGTPVDSEAVAETKVEEEKGRGKRKKIVNKLYQRDFSRHDLEVGGFGSSHRDHERLRSHVTFGNSLFFFNFRGRDLHGSCT
jgi:hypothetical protein